MLYTLQREQGNVSIADLSASFQQAVIDILVGKTLRAAKASGKRLIAVVGVSLNEALRSAFQEACDKAGLQLVTASPDFCTDNAAMIAFAALLRHLLR